MIRGNSHQLAKTFVIDAALTIGLAITVTQAVSQNSGIWNKSGSMNTACENHTATLLQNGQVLVAGGLNNAGRSVAPSCTTQRRVSGRSPAA